MLANGLGGSSLQVGLVHKKLEVYCERDKIAEVLERAEGRRMRDLVVINVCEYNRLKVRQMRLYDLLQTTKVIAIPTTAVVDTREEEDGSYIERDQLAERPIT